jgi:hypothetical protein
MDSSRLNHAHLIGAQLRAASLKEAVLDSANLSAAYLQEAQLSGAMLRGAILRRVELKGAVASGASFRAANLEGADLDGADLRRADFTDAYLGSGEPTNGSRLAPNFEDADLDSTIFEPAVIPDPRAIAFARNLHTLTYQRRPGSMIELRNAFRAAGFRYQDRQVAYALVKARNKHRSIPAVMLLTVLFDWTCRYGLAPFRPIWILVVLGVVCAAIYWGAAYLAPDGGLFEISEGESTEHSKPVRRQVRSLKLAVLFSLMSTFNYRFQSLDFGNWIRNLLHRDIQLEGKGWVRTVSGAQALLSLWLIGLSILTLFGNPFDNLL